MKKSILLSFCLLGFVSSAHAAWNEKIVNVSNKQEIKRNELLVELAAANIVVIGEKHYTKEVQSAEGKLINDVVNFTNNKNKFSVSWEFLNASSQLQTESLFNKVITNEISSEEFLLKTQGSKNAVFYSPIIDAAASLGGKLYGVNLSREEKAPVIKGGLEALDPKLLPPDFKLGGTNYLERFTETMKDHATPDQIRNYFAAQSLVDDVSAYHLLTDSNYSLKFLVIGAFHSMYNDGVVARIKDRDSLSKVSNVEIIDASDYTNEELESVITDAKYGHRADFIIFVNGPVSVSVH